MVKQEKTVLTSSTGAPSPVNTPRRASYYRLLLDETGTKPRKSMLPDRLAEPFRELLLSLSNLSDDPMGYIAFWGRHHWWSNVFLKEAAEGYGELFKLRDQLRRLWRPNTLPAETWVNYVYQPLGVRAKGIRKVLSDAESKKLLDRGASRLYAKSLMGEHSPIPASYRRRMDLYEAVEMGELKLEEGESAHLWEGHIVVEEKSRVRQRGFTPPIAPEVLKWIEPASGPNTAGPLFLWRQGRILPDPFNLRAMLALAVADNANRFAKCKNPDCPAPYFLRKRKTQRYCERGECTEYAQRRYSLDWWNREGKSRRKQRQRKSRKPKFRERMARH